MIQNLSRRNILLINRAFLQLQKYICAILCEIVAIAPLRIRPLDHRAPGIAPTIEIVPDVFQKGPAPLVQHAFLDKVEVLFNKIK